MNKYTKMFEKSTGFICNNRKIGIYTDNKGNPCDQGWYMLNFAEYLIGLLEPGRACEEF